MKALHTHDTSMTTRHAYSSYDALRFTIGSNKKGKSYAQGTAESMKIDHYASSEKVKSAAASFNASSQEREPGGHQPHR